ncbi:hypothetical protein RIR_jg38343.t1 [Rhizophagus irregularis DAOM 181602=DAOM 197198]|nr:hypothetical protein RIR_jg38343.t1 [Rhizophagus irregularis DAOM 181602=DAOM 197198]
MNERMLILQKESTSFWVLTKKEKVLFRELYIKFSCGAVALWLTDLRATMLDYTILVHYRTYLRYKSIGITSDNIQLLSLLPRKCILLNLYD